MPINLLLDDMPANAAPVNLLADLDPMELAKLEIDRRYPRMPDALKSMILSLSQQLPQGALQTAGAGADVLNQSVEGAGLPAASRGLLSGLIAPGRYAAKGANLAAEMTGYEPSQFLENISQPLPVAPTGQAPRIPYTDISLPVAPAAEIVGDIAGSSVSGTPLFKGLSQLLQGAKVPKMLATPAAAALTGSALSPEMPVTGAAVGLVAPAAAKIGSFAANDLPEAIGVLMKKPNHKAAFDKMLQSHDAMDRVSSHLYDHAEKLAGGREIKPVKVADDILQSAESGLKPASNYDDLIKKAKQGDYQSLVKIQSDMGNRARKILSNKNVTQAELDAAEDLMNARSRLNKKIKQHLIQEGHHDIAAVRQQADKLYADKMQTYFDKNLKPTVRNIFTSGKRLRPGQTDKDLIKPFMERSEAMDKFLAKHPEIQAEVELERAKQQAVSKLYPLSKGAKLSGLGGGMIKIAEILKDII